MSRSQFTFYESFASALSRIKKKADRADAYDAICNYALYGTEPDLDKLPDSAAIAFELIKPTLDSSRRKAENGKRGAESKQAASKPQANRKQTESKQVANRKREQSVSEKENEGEKEKEKEIENECYPPTPFPANQEANDKQVFAYYLDRVNPMASQTSLDELKGYVSQMGAACCMRAIDIALDEKKATWAYIRGILRSKLAAGVKSMADWDELDKKREEGKKHVAGNAPAAGANADGSFQGWRARSAIDDAD